jgi:hypothetical protein
MITGRQLVLSKDYYQRKLDKCDGDISRLESSYVCKEAKDLIKRGYDVEKTRDLLGVSIETTISEQLVTEIRSEGKNLFRNIPKFNVSNYTSTKTDPEVSEFLHKVFNK